MLSDPRVPGRIAEAETKAGPARSRRSSSARSRTFSAPSMDWPARSATVESKRACSASISTARIRVRFSDSWVHRKGASTVLRSAAEIPCCTGTGKTMRRMDASTHADESTSPRRLRASLPSTS